MPAGRTTPAYTPSTPPALTPEEEAALAAEQAAAAPPPQTTMYQPSSPPPAEPVAAPVEQTTMYQPSSPPPAPAETTYAPSPTPSSPALDATANQVQQNTGWSPTGPEMQATVGYIQDRGKAGVAPSGETRIAPPPQTGPFGWTLDALAPLGAIKDGSPPGGDSYSPSEAPALPKAGIAGGLSNTLAYRQNAPVATTDEPNPPQPGESIGDMLARSFGGNVNDPQDNLYQQAVNSLYRQGGDVLGRGTRWAGEGAANILGDQLRFYRDRTGEMLGTGGAILADQAGFYGGETQRLAEGGKNLAQNLWRAGEAVIGPHGTGVRQAQSTFNPVGLAIAENIVDPLGGAKDAVVNRLNLDDVSSGAQDFFSRGAERIQNATEGKSNLGDDLNDLLTMNLPTFGQPVPQPHDVDLSNPEWSWLLYPREVASRAGSEAGLTLRHALDAEVSRQGQLAKGAAIGARLNGGNPLDMAQAATRSLAGNLPARLPSVDRGDLASMIYMPRDPLTELSDPLQVRDPEAARSGTQGNVRTSSADLEAAQPSWWDRARDAAADILPNVAGLPGAAYLPRDPDTAQVDPALAQQARNAAQAAKAWAAGIDLPDMGVSIRYPDDQFTVGEGAPLPVRRSPMPPRTVEDGSQIVVRRTGPVEGIDPNALYMPLPPEPTLMDRARNAGSDMLQVIDDRLPDVSLPGRGSQSGVGTGGRSAGAAESPSLRDRLAALVPDVTLPYINLPGGGTPATRGEAGTGGSSAGAAQPVADITSRAERTTTIPQGMTASQQTAPDGRQHTWLLNGNGDYAGVVDPATGEYVLFPQGASNAELQALVDRVLGAPSASGQRTTTLPEGLSTADKNGYTWIKGPNGETDYRGLVDPATGEFVLFPEGVTQEQVDAIVASVVGSGTSGNSAPGPATAAANTATPSNTSTSTARGSNGGSITGSGETSTASGSSSTGSTRSSGRRSTSGSDDDGDSAPLKLEDFIQDFDGDGTISKRDRMQGKKAFEQAKAERAKRMRGKNSTRSRQTNTGFPFDRQPSPIRTQVLDAIAASQRG